MCRSAPHGHGGLFMSTFLISCIISLISSLILIMGIENFKNRPVDKTVIRPKEEHTMIVSEVLQDIGSAKNFAELYGIIDKMKGFQGSRDFFDANQLKKLINDARFHGGELNNITRAEGLRNKVKELIEAEGGKTKS